MKTGSPDRLSRQRSEINALRRTNAAYNLLAWKKKEARESLAESAATLPILFSDDWRRCQGVAGVSKHRCAKPRCSPRADNCRRIGSGRFTRRAINVSLISKNDLQPETTKMPEEPIAADAAGRVAQLDADQLAAWICAAPEPQRSALAFFYLNEFSHREMQNLLDVKMNELAQLDLAAAGRNFRPG